MLNFNCKENLVHAYHILAHLGLDDHTYTHLSAKADDNSFFIYKFGLRFSEVTLQNLLRVSFDGDVLEGKENYYNRTGYVIHSSIYKNRPDINYIFHIHTPHITAVSSLEEGLLPINQWALHFYGKIVYHSYNSLAIADDYGSHLSSDLKENMVMLMRHHGAIMCGKTVQEAMFYTYHLEQACKTQFITLSMNKKYLNIPKEVCQKSVTDLLSFEQNLGERDWNAWIRVINKL